MLSRENRVFATSWAALAAFVAMSMYTGIRHDPVVWFVVVSVLGFLGPQLVLASVDDSVLSHHRARIGVVLTIAVAILGFNNVATGQQRLIAVLCGALFVSVVGSELVGGFRAAANE